VFVATQYFIPENTGKLSFFDRTDLQNVSDGVANSVTLRHHLSALTGLCIRPFPIPADSNIRSIKSWL
jgi:hypothetical protein